MKQFTTLGRRRILRYFFVAALSLSTTVVVSAQQRFITYASGPQAGNTSARHIIASVTVQPPFSPGNAANLVFQGCGGTPFPAGATTFIGGGGIPNTQVGFPPDSSWLISFDVNAQVLASLRRNAVSVVVNTSEFP